MHSHADLEAQAEFLVSRHGPAAQQRIAKQLSTVGKTANSREIQYWKSLLKLVTQKLRAAAATPAHT